MGHKSFVRHVADEGLPAMLLIAINLALLSAFAIANKIEPGIGLWICKLVLPKAIPDGTAGVYMAFRLSLYAFASVVALLLTVGVLLFGVTEVKPGAGGKPPRWQKMLFVAIVIPVIWVFYPLYALSKDYPVTNDLSYFVLTFLVFSGFPLLMHAFSRQYGRSRKMGVIYQVRL